MRPDELPSRTRALSAWWPASIASVGLHAALGVVCAGWIVGGGGGSGAELGGSGDDVVFELRVRPRASAENVATPSEIVTDVTELVASAPAPIDPSGPPNVESALLEEPVVPLPIVTRPEEPARTAVDDVVATPSVSEPVASAGELASSASSAPLASNETTSPASKSETSASTPHALPGTTEPASSSGASAAPAIGSAIDPQPTATARDGADREPTSGASSSSSSPGAAGIGTPIGETRAAVLVDGPRPVYPHESELRGEHGVVLCTIHVAADGTVARVEVTRTSGFARLDRAVIDGLKRWRFRPALEAGRAVASQVKHSVSFVFE